MVLRGQEQGGNGETVSKTTLQNASFVLGADAKKTLYDRCSERLAAGEHAFGAMVGQKHNSGKGAWLVEGVLLVGAGRNTGCAPITERAFTDALVNSGPLIERVSHYKRLPDVQYIGMWILHPDGQSEPTLNELKRARTWLADQEDLSMVVVAVVCVERGEFMLRPYLLEKGSSIFLRIPPWHERDVIAVEKQAELARVVTPRQDGHEHDEEEEH